MFNKEILNDDMAWRVISLQQTKQAELKICLRAYDDGKLKQVVDAIPHFRSKSLDFLLDVAVRRRWIVQYALDEKRTLDYLRQIAHEP